MPVKLNPENELFNDNMFVKLRGILEGVTPPADLPLLDMSIGEPQMPGSTLLVDSMVRHNRDWHAYPKAPGHECFTDAVCRYIARRWPLAAPLATRRSQIIPVPGTREPLAFLGNLVRNTKANPVALITNPYYHAWRAGALQSGAELVYMDTKAETGFLPDLDALTADQLDRTTIMYLCSPSNPQGAVMDMAFLQQALKLARAHDFLLVMDECYTDIWRGTAPVGMAEAAMLLQEEAGAPDDPLANLVILNSLSKRSSAAGIRAGFLFGDAQIIAAYLKLVANAGSLVPTPILRVAADLYDDEAHVVAIRSHYDHSFAIAARYLNVAIPAGGFCLWLPVDDGVAFTRRLMAEQALRAMPGAFMTHGDGTDNVGRQFVRLALVHAHDKIETAMARVAQIYNDGVA